MGPFFLFFWACPRPRQTPGDGVACFRGSVLAETRYRASASDPFAALRPCRPLTQYYLRLQSVIFVRMKTIVITGPECAGKSQLTADLQKALGGWRVSEYARTYLNQLPRPYRASDLLAIAAGQEKSYYLNRSHFPNAPWAFLDTWDYVLEIWSELRFGRVHPQLLGLRDRISVDHYLLCAPDLPWIADPLREHPESRKELFSRYQSALDRDGVSYSVVQGRDSARNQTALTALQALDSN